MLRQSKVKELQEALKKSQRNFNHLDESCKRLRVELEQVKQVEKEKSKTAEILKKQVRRKLGFSGTQLLSLWLLAPSVSHFAIFVVSE